MSPVVLYQYTPPLFFLRDHNGNCVIPAIAPYAELFNFLTFKMQKFSILMNLYLHTL